MSCLKLFKHSNVKHFKILAFQNYQVFGRRRIKYIRNNLDKINNWENIYKLIPKFYFDNKMKKTGVAGIFSASLELTKEGVVSVSQKKLFDELMIKKL